jgi:phasin family protein
MMCDMIYRRRYRQIRPARNQAGHPARRRRHAAPAACRGKAKAMDMCLTARFIDAAEAERAGLVARVIAADKLLEETLAAAATIAGFSLPVVMMIKESVNRAYESGLHEGLLFERRTFHSAFALADQKEGMAAFVEKRKPVFRDTLNSLTQRIIKGPYGPFLLFIIDCFYIYLFQQKFFVASHQKSVDMAFSMPIIRTMMHCNIAPENRGERYENQFNSDHFLNQFQENTMNATTEQFASANKANVETLLTIANTAFASAERLAALNLNTARAMLEDSVANAKALLAVKDVQQLIAMQTTLAQPAVEKAVAYSRSVYEIATQTQEELSKVVEGQFSEMNKNVATALDKAAKNAPAGSDVAVAAVKSAIAAANSAYDSMTKAAKQVAEIAEANVAAATTATVKAVGTGAAAPKAKKAA